MPQGSVDFINSGCHICTWLWTCQNTCNTPLFQENFIMHIWGGTKYIGQTLYRQVVITNLHIRRWFISLTCFVWSVANPWARCAVNVLLPTPPFPDKTTILCFTCDNRSLISATAEKNSKSIFLQEFWLADTPQFSMVN